MRRARLTVTAAAAATLLVGGLVGASTAGATSDDPTGAAAANQAAGPLVSDPGKNQRIATLNTALKNIEARLAAKTADPTNKNLPGFNLGAIDLRDIFSYRLDRLWSQGVDGFGTTVAVMEGWDLDGIQDRLNALDDQVGLPHTTVTTIFPNGPKPAQCPAGMDKLGSFGSCKAWGGELALDVEAVHILAPYAKILIVATPSDSEVVGDPSSEVAMPEIMKGLQYISAHHLANVASISDGSSETDYSRGESEIRANDPGELAAAAAGIPVMVATGDCGSSQNLTTATRQCGATSPGPASATWDDSPFMTAVGGALPAHTLIAPSDKSDTFALHRIEGAGLSEIYRRPSFQDGVKDITGSPYRSVPDITMNSTDGTSQSAPEFAAVLAMATQVNHGHNLGPINDFLYRGLARNPVRNGIIDVTTGDNHEGSIPGYTATQGFDVASGWGTVDASLFVPAAARASHGDNPLQREAWRQLNDLQHQLSLTPSTTIPSAQPLDVLAHGFLPDHPVTISIDGKALVTVTASTSGNINYAFIPSVISLATGKHTLSIHSLLLDQSKTFTVTS